jgi:hypothetical protein
MKLDDEVKGWGVRYLYCSALCWGHSWWRRVVTQRVICCGLAAMRCWGCALVLAWRLCLAVANRYPPPFALTPRAPHTHITPNTPSKHP